MIGGQASLSGKYMNMILKKQNQNLHYAEQTP